MRKHVQSSFPLVLLLLTALPALAENRTVNAQSLYVRANPRGFFVGTLYQGAGFYRQQTSGDYSAGYAGGNFQGCGWVETRYTSLGGSTPAGCAGSAFTGTGTASRQFLLDHYASRVNDYIPGRSLPLLDGGSSVRVKPGVITIAYGNYRNGAFRNAYAYVDSSIPFAWRWVSDDGRAVAVNAYPGDASRSGWMFIPRDALPDQLPYSDGVYR